jgi:transposase
VVEGKSGELRELVGARHTLQSKRGALINALRGSLKHEGQRVPEKFFARRDWQGGWEKLKGGAATKQIRWSFMSSIEGRAKAEAELTEKRVGSEDEREELRERIPSGGQLTARVVWGAIDEVTRCDNKKAVAKDGALTPTIDQSGQGVPLGRINRDGRHEVRRVLLQGAHTLVRMKSVGATPWRECFGRVAQRRGQKIALVALARKRLTTAYGVLQSGQPYDPRQLAPQAA